MARLTKSFNVKHDKSMSDLMLIHPILLMIFADFNLWAYERNLPVAITRVVDEKIPGVSISTTHEEGRAIDISLKGWTTDDIDDCIYHFNEKYSEEYGAFSYSDGLPRLLVPPDHGTARHLHFQIRRFQ